MTDQVRRFSFCPKCGGTLELRQLKGKERLVCRECRYVFYENPIVGVAVILQTSDRRILLGRRAKHATYPGLWCIPCGYVEYDEDVRDAARREFLEETGLEVELGPVFTVLSNFHNPETHTVGIWFQAEIIGGCLQAGDDIDAVGWHDLDNPPPLAFPSDFTVLELLNKCCRDTISGV
jgi:ADP-ribose pyrophosphatase YjhB (NUDIX family)